MQKASPPKLRPSGSGPTATPDGSTAATTTTVVWPRRTSKQLLVVPQPPTVANEVNVTVYALKGVDLSVRTSRCQTSLQQHGNVWRVVCGGRSLVLEAMWKT